MKMLIILLLLSIIPPLSGFTATIAIIDSGTDMEHEQIEPKAWINPVDIPNNNRDEDGNGYKDDVFGWNFAESNNQVIDYKYLGTLNDDIRKFFDIQAKAMLGTMVQEELDWIKEKVQDQEFIRKVTLYGNFMHGTHVPGIASKGSQEAKILAIKLLPTEQNIPNSEMLSRNDNKGISSFLIKKALKRIAKGQSKIFNEIATYIDGHKASVANGSFGTGYHQACAVVTMMFQNFLKRDPTPEELKEISIYFLKEVIKSNSSMINKAPKTLFVFASGNDGLDNDEFPASPTNIKADNAISVGATIGFGPIAPFSNYGKEMVDVVAPGVNIESSVPGNQYLQVSGTSQAAPFVANIAAQIKDGNSNLTPKQIKTILMNTVDKRDDLKDKIKSGGVINPERAIYASTLSKSMNLEEAISQARDAISDLRYDKSFRSQPIMIEGLIRPLPSPFNIKK